MCTLETHVKTKELMCKMWKYDLVRVVGPMVRVNGCLYRGSDGENGTRSLKYYGFDQIKCHTYNGAKWPNQL